MSSVQKSGMEVDDAFENVLKSVDENSSEVEAVEAVEDVKEESSHPFGLLHKSA